jgi:RND family efflux transporter MFP subunit
MHDTAARSDLAQRWLRGYCERDAAGVKSAVVVLGTAQALQEAAHWPATPAAPSAPLLAAARAAVKRERGLVLTPPVGERAGADAGRILSLPLTGAHGALGALAVAVHGGPADTDETLLRELETAAATLAGALQDPPATTARPSPTAGTTTLLQLQGLLLAPQPLAQAATALASELASTLGFERASLALHERAALRLIGLSHGAEFAPRQALIQALTAAMQEAIDQGVSIAYPLPPEAPPRIVQAHAALAAQSPGALLSVPLISAGTAIGALCLERTAPIGTDSVRSLEQLACVLAPLLELKQRAEQPWHQRARASLYAALAHPRQRTHRLRWLAAAAAALLLASVPIRHHIGAPARLEGAVQRVLAAPTDGYLHAAHVRPGDAVQAGQLLLELAQQDLLLQTRKWQAELTQYENSAAAALARADRAQYALAQAQAAEAGAQLALAREQLARTQLTAPIDGWVIKGDLSQSLGAPVQRGERLLTLAPRAAFRLIVEVDERDIAAITTGQRGQLALSALPGERLAFTVTRISPVAISHDGRNAFEVEAALDQPPDTLRPGLQGVAKITAPPRPLAWIATHRLGAWLQLKLWRWTGASR